MIRYLTVYTSTEFLCLLIAFFALITDKNKTWKYFWVYLLITLLIELTSIYLKIHGHYKTTWLYSILTIFEIGFIAAMFRNILSKYVHKWTLFNSALALIALLYIGETIIYQSLNVRHNITNSTLGIFIVIASLSYLYLLLKDDTYISLAKDSDFWWVVGTLFFYFGFMSINILYDLLKDNFSKPGPLFSYTFKVLNVIFYTVWSYAFICRRWKQKN
jgi:hypothetical protein